MTSWPTRGCADNSNRRPSLGGPVRRVAGRTCDLPHRPAVKTTLGRVYTDVRRGKRFRPSLFVTTTLDSYGPVRSDDQTPLTRRPTTTCAFPSDCVPWSLSAAAPVCVWGECVGLRWEAVDLDRGLGVRDEGGCRGRRSRHGQAVPQVRGGPASGPAAPVRRRSAAAAPCPLPTGTGRTGVQQRGRWPTSAHSVPVSRLAAGVRAGLLGTVRQSGRGLDRELAHVRWRDNDRTMR